MKNHFPCSIYCETQMFRPRKNLFYSLLSFLHCIWGEELGREMISMMRVPYQSRLLVGGPGRLTPGPQLIPLPVSAGCPKDVHFLKASVPCAPSEKKSRQYSLDFIALVIIQVVKE